jgi:cytoskeleton protein RodZ
MRFAEPAWVEVTQADGRVVHSQINEAGTEHRIDAAGPLRLVIGNASAVTIEFRGKPVDLKPVTSQDNVARLTLANSR